MLQLDAQEVAARLDRATLIVALDRAFRAECHSPQRQHYAIGDSPAGGNVLLVMPAWRTGGPIGVKLVTVFPGNAARGHSAVHAAYTLFDAATGAPRAVLDGTELTRRRTAAASALAARYLANPHASRFLMVGTGALAPHLIESHVTVRPIRDVRIWGRRPERARELARGFAGRLDVEAVADLESAVAWAEIISCATMAEVPLVHGAWLRPGQHLDLVGSFTAAMRETDDEALARASLYVDTRAGALAESGELIHAMGAGVIDAASIKGELADLARGTALGRRATEEITLFKSVGCATQDLAAAELAVDGPPGID